MAMAPFPSNSLLILLLFLAFFSTSSKALTITSENPNTLTPQEGTTIYQTLKTLVSSVTPSTAYPNGRMFVNYINVNGKGVAVRLVRWSSACAVNLSETTSGIDLIQAFETLIPYLETYAVKGYAWAAISNRTYWADYFVRSQYDLLTSAVTLPEISRRVLAGKRKSGFRVSSGSDCPASPAGILLSYSWGTGNAFSVLERGGFLRSPDGEVELSLQADCDVVLRRREGVLWRSKTAGRENCSLKLHGDGNVVLGDFEDVFWESGTACRPFTECAGTTVLMVENERVVLYRSLNNTLDSVWATDMEASRPFPWKEMKN